jgi:hypothetical protein
MELKGFFYIPSWLKLFLIVLITSGFGSSLFIVVKFLFDGHGPDYIIVALSVLQSLGYALLFILLAFFVEKQTSLQRVASASEFFLQKEIPEALAKKVWLLHKGTIKYAEVKVITEVGGTQLPSSLVGWYQIDLLGDSLFLHIWFNLKNFLLIFYIPPENKLNEDGLPEGLESSLRGFTEMQFEKMVCEKETLEPFDKEALGLYLYARLKESHPLENALDRLFWINDISNLTRSFFRQAQLGRVSLWKKGNFPNREF